MESILKYILKNLNFEEISRETGIRSKHLENLEEGNYQNLPGDIYVENFLKIYGKYLGLDAEELIKIYQKEQEAFQCLKERNNRKNFGFPLIKFSKTSVLIISIAIVVVYLGLTIRKSIIPPKLTVIHPADNLITQDKEIEILGQTEKDSQVTINGQIVFCDDQGRFEDSLILQGGLNVIRIAASKKHSREKVVLKKIIVITEKKRLKQVKSGIFKKKIVGQKRIFIPNARTKKEKLSL